MALNKQRILNELGSVMNQLQSADCGCMGKLFSNPGPDSQGMGHPLPTCGGCRRGFCHGHGYGGAPGAGEPYSMDPACMNAGGMNAGGMNAGGMNAGGMNTGNMNAGGMNRMGRCNPTQLYADTYGYLNQNLMQPVVQEVYQDLSSISPANTIGNNPLAQKMGLPQGNAGMQGNTGSMAGQEQMAEGGMGHQNAMQNMGGMPAGNANPMMNNPNNNMGGMGAQIMHMMMSGGGGKPSGTMPGQSGQMNNTMLIDAPHSPHGQVGVTPLTGANQGYQGGNTGMSPMGHSNPNANSGTMGAHMQNPVTQYVTQDNMYTGANAIAQGHPMTGSPTGNQVTGNQMAGNQMAGNQMAGNQMAGNQMAGNQMAGNQMAGNTMAGNQMVANQMAPSAGNPMTGNMNPGSQQPGVMNPNQRAYGQHTAGITKFNEMFPGVMQGGDLGFDPMALAIQMNPANQKRSAMDTMQKLMNGPSKGYGAGTNAGMMQPGGAGINAVQPNQQTYNPTQVPQQNMIPTNQVTASQQNFSPVSGGPMGNQQIIQGHQQATTPNAGAMYANQPQVYTVQSTPGMNQQQMFQQQVPQQQVHQQMIDPNTGAPMATANAGYEETSADPNAQIQQSEPPAESAEPVQEMYKEPIFPADTSRNHPALPYTKRFMQYNTLGQPVELLPGKTYHTPIPKLPQTLSPQSAPSRGKFGVKSTVSKTSIVGNRSVGRTPSRGQLQQIYQQYKGSQSYTQQNLGAPGQPTTNSDGRLYATTNNAKPQQQIPVEKVGGDTISNRQQVINNQVTNKVDHVMGQIGDVPPANKPQGDVPVEKVCPAKQARCRNGLQDMVYTSYPTSAAWSFHGDYDSPISAAYRARNRV